MRVDIREQVKKEMDRMMPYKEVEYRNGIVASIIANGRKEKLTEDWVMRTLMGDVEDGFISYEQAVYIQKEYYKAIEKVKAIY